ncbi:hypothetical protein ACJZ2D_006404 [Fusarium nematophilum]
MDSFSKLPSEIRTEIIINVESRKDIMSLIHASPVMCSQYIVSKRTIMRSILTRIISGHLHDDLLQDALGIIYFPSTDLESVHQHLAQWAVHKFPHPLGMSDYDPSTLWKLCHLFSRIVMFVDDYASKATDPFSPRAYLTLPSIISGNDRLFKGRAVDIKPIVFNELIATERHRFLGAFLRYEMLCKVYSPPVWALIEHTRSADLVAEVYEKLQPQERMSFWGVFEYVKAAYGSIFAHCQDAWLPDRPGVFHTRTRLSQNPREGKDKDPSPDSEPGLLYPDTVYFDAGEYLKTAIDTRRRHMADVLPCLGLDLLTQILVLLTKDGTPYDHLKSWLLTFTKEIEEYYRLWNSRKYVFSLINKSHTYDPDVFLWRLSKASRQIRLKNLEPRWLRPYWEPVNETEREEQFRLHELQLHIFRQRAWGLFDDTRLYRDVEQHFPSMDALDHRRAAGFVFAALVEKARRRSQRWQDWYAGRSLKIPSESDASEDKEMVESNNDRLPRFFEEASLGGIPTFWRQGRGV